MKKLFVFLGVLAMSAGVVFAQENTSDIFQDGNDNVATVTQDDEGIGNSADVDQIGHRNNTVIDQPVSDDGLFGPSSVVTLQDGNDNDIYVRQQYNRGYNSADIHQDGNRNRVDLVQDNKDNEAIIQQFGHDNSADINLQRNFGMGENGEGYIFLNQDGNRNVAHIDQDARDFEDGDGSVKNWVRAYQVGNDNFLDVDQLRGGSEEEENYADLRQEGHRNVLRLEQAVAPSYAWIKQDGNDNRVAKTDEDFGFQPYDHAYQAASEITILQEGNRNEIGLYQENTWTDSNITQLGHDNQTLLYQTDGNGYATVLQDGNGNQANVWQSTE